VRAETRATDNTRNGYTLKTVSSKFGEINLEVPRDRKSEFDLQVVRKRQKELLGLWICETESAKHWLSVLNELKNRGIGDVLVFSVDNLEGISEAIRAVYPRAEVQKCIVHQIRNSLRYVSWKERKAMAKNLRRIYEAATEEEDSAGLAEFSEKWDKRYPYVSASWKSNWSEIATFFKFPPKVRALIHTTNPIESLHRKIKEVAKIKAIFPNDQALIKLVFLAVEEASKKWTFRHQDWAMIYSQLMIFFGDRLGKQV
jgi:putative transposase